MMLLSLSVHAVAFFLWNLLHHTPLHHLLSLFVGGVNSAREQDSSIGGGANNVCLGVVHMEEEVQDREYK